MKLHAPKLDQRFMSIIDDVDGDHIDIEFHATREAAEAHVTAQYEDIPDTTEPGGESYLDGTDERPNVRIFITELLSRTTL